MNGYVIPRRQIYYLVKLRNQDDGQADTLLEESSPTCVVIMNLMPLQVKTSISLQGNPLLLQFLSKRFPPALVFESPVTRLEKDRDRTGPRPIRTGNSVRPIKTVTVVRSSVHQHFGK
jgi:hypothetical protein